LAFAVHPSVLIAEKHEAIPGIAICDAGIEATLEIFDVNWPAFDIGSSFPLEAL